METGWILGFPSGAGMATMGAPGGRRNGEMTRIDWKWAFAIALVAGLTLPVLEERPSSSNPATRLASALAFVETGAWALDGSPFLWTHDKVFHDGHFYSSKPPAFEWLAAGLYAVLRGMGLSFENHPVWVYRVLIFLISFLPFLGAVVLTGWLAHCPPPVTAPEAAGRSERDASWSWTAPVAVGLASLLWPYATTLSNHPLTAFLALAALWAVRRTDGDARGAGLRAGLLAGSVALFEISVGLMWILAMGLLVWRNTRCGHSQEFFGAQRHSAAATPLCPRAGTEPPSCQSGVAAALCRRTPYLYLLGVAGMIAGGLFLNWQRHGSVWPAYLHSDWYEYDGSVFADSLAPEALGVKPYATAASRLWHVTFGHYGVFLMTPLLLFGVAGAWIRARRGDWEAGTITACAVALLLGVALNPSARGADLGGGSYGLRWFSSLAPMVLLYLPEALRRWKSMVFRGLALVAAVVSMTMAAVGVFITPWPHNALSPYPFLDNPCVWLAANTDPPHPAVEAIIEATSLDRSLAYHDLGTIYFKRDRFDEAAQALDRSLRLATAVPLPHDGTRYPTGRTNAAVGPRAAARQTETRYLMAQALERGGKLERAYATLAALLRDAPDHAGALSLLGIVLTRQNRAVEALAIYDRLLAGNPDNVSALNNSALNLAATGQTTAALKRLDHSLSVRANNFEALYNKALLLEQAGERAAALGLARQALSRQPGHEGCGQLLRRLEKLPRNPR